MKEQLEAEFDEYLGYDRYERSDSTDYRNNIKPKEIKSFYSEIIIDIPQTVA